MDACSVCGRRVLFHDCTYSPCWWQAFVDVVVLRGDTLCLACAAWAYTHGAWE